MLSKSAFNALLKTLEEPPEHVHFILATTEVHKVPETIISRCQKFDFKRIDVADIVYRLKHIAEKEKLNYETKALNLIAKIADGGMRDAITMFEKVISDQGVTYQSVADGLDITSIHMIEGLYEDLRNQRVEAALEKVNDLYEGGASLSQFTKDLISFLRDKWIKSIQENEKDLQSELLYMIELFEKAAAELKVTLIPQLPLEVAVVRTGTKEGLEVPKEEEKTKKRKTNRRGKF